MKTKIAENIRAYRKQRGLTQEQLTEVLGVSVGAVYKWESKSSLPERRLIWKTGVCRRSAGLCRSERNGRISQDSKAPGCCL